MVVTDIKKETANTSNQASKQPNDNVELEQGALQQQAGSAGNVEVEQGAVQQVGSTGNVEAKHGAVQKGPKGSAELEPGKAGVNGVVAQEQASGQQGEPSTIVVHDQGSAPEQSAVATQPNGESASASNPNGPAVASANPQSNQEAPSAQAALQTREQLMKERAHGNVGAGADQPESDTETKSNKRMRVRLIPIWLRLIILFLAMVFSLTIGAMVGYGTIGGGNAWDVLKQSTWTHIVDIINKE